MIACGSWRSEIPQSGAIHAPPRIRTTYVPGCSNSSNFARWPHLGPIPPMDGGGHWGPLSYVYGYRGGVGRRGVSQDTTGDDGIELRARARRYQLIPSRCVAGFVPKSAISEISRSGQRKNGRSGGNFLSAKRRAWAVLDGIPSGWGQFGAVKKWAVVIGGLRRQLNAKCAIATAPGESRGSSGRP
jgi:hypothetical protein